VTLTFCPDVAAADWIAHCDVPWQRLVEFGPAGFEAYARLRFLPDPVRPGQSENDAARGDWRDQQLPILFEVLATQTTTPADCYFCVWDGFDQAGVVIDDGDAYVDAGTDPALFDPDARPGWRPAPIASTSSPYVSQVVVPHRAYWLFRGPVADLRSWDAAEGWPRSSRLGGAQPAFVWPADHAWCLAWDVDPHWAGLGGTSALITRLVDDPRLDVVPADPTQEQPHYR
jgi:hypothetical protein